MEFYYFKLEIFIPKDNLFQMRECLRQVDAGHLGNYDCALSYSIVKSTWRPLEGSNPYIGEEGKLHEEEEYKIEVTVEAAKLDETLSAIKACHPYEEPGINVIPLYKIGL